jgi:hypothetical protein
MYGSSAIFISGLLVLVLFHAAGANLATGANVEADRRKNGEIIDEKSSNHG